MYNRGDTAASLSSPPAAMLGGGRLEWIDVARGIGIIAVVIGHVWTSGPLRDAVYSFHMPLFFLLSGMLSRPQPVAGFTRRQLGSQMRPYVAFLLLLLLLDQIIEPLKGNRPIFSDWPQDLAPVLLGGTWLRGPYTIFWFVPCLMAARILFNALQVRWPRPFDWRWLVTMPFVLIVAYGLGQLTTVSPLGLLSVPMALFLLWVGAAWGEIGWRHWMWLPLAIASIAGLSSLVPTLNMKVADYGWPLLSMASAIGTSLLIFRVAVHLTPFGSWLAGVGRASLVIMYLHVGVIHYLSQHMGRIWLFILALALPVAAYRLFRALPLARRIFL